MTAIFIVALGYDLWYYVLGYSGVIEYKMNTPLQKLGKRTSVKILVFILLPPVLDQQDANK